MKNITKQFRRHYQEVFSEHGSTSRGVDWGDERELCLRYAKFFSVVANDPFAGRKGRVSILDVGCGWGGFYKFIAAQNNKSFQIDYTGIDVVPEMIDEASRTYTKATFHNADLFDLPVRKQYDYVICNGVLTQKLSASIPDMESYANNLISRMYDLCQRGIAFNHMSHRVNFMVENLYYRNPIEVLIFCFTHLSPRVVLDHALVSTNSAATSRVFDYIVYVYKENRRGKQ
jgi:SAM-dependent methyltransferase